MRKPRRRRTVLPGSARLLSNAGKLVISGLLTGVVVAAAAFPIAAIAGLVAKAGADEFDRLPTQLLVQQAPQISYVYASDRKTLISTFYDENRRDVHLADVAPVMRQAIVAAEDMRFYEHHGVDVKGVARAYVANRSAGETQQGASTLTMQYVRQALEYSATTPQAVVDATADTVGRKVREMRYALALEKQLTKDEILERYLNLAPFGHSAFGIYAAAQVYFNKLPKDLTLPEAALLAGLVKAPSAYDPTTEQGRPAALNRRNDYVLANMVKMGYITAAQRQETMKEPVKITGRPTPNGCPAVVDNSWGFFCDYLYRWWLNQPAFGADAFEREARLKSGGYVIYTSLDVNAQASAKRNVEKYDRTGSNPTALMLAGVEPNTGRIQLMAANRTYSNDQSNNGPNSNPGKRGQRGTWPNTSNPLISGGGDINGYQFGSSFKVFTLVGALQQGVPLNHTINTVSPYVSDYIIEPGSPAACQGNHYCPVNANPAWMNGPRNMWTGLGRSVNTYWVPLEHEIGAQNAVNAAKQLGIQFRASSDADLANDPHSAKGWGAFTLGVSAATPLDMANAYATLAAEGKYCEPLPVVEIQDFNGAKLDAANPRCHQAIDPAIARAATDAMRCPVGDQSAFGQCDGATAPNVREVVGKPVAGKTGTTDGDQTAALIAMTKQLAVAGIVADPDWAFSTQLRRNLGGRDPHSEVVNLAVIYTLRDAVAGKPWVNFAAPPPTLAFGAGGRPTPPASSKSPTPKPTKRH